MTTVKTPADEAEARAIQDELRARVVLDEPGPLPGQGLIAGVD
ncbi:endonuclease V, partial [Streptomyces sp. NPDC059564]